MARPAQRHARSARARFIQRPIVVALVACGAIAPLGANAATIVVTTAGDAGGGCTLRQAVESLNAASLQGTCANSGAGFGTSDTVDLATQIATIGPLITLGGTEIPVTVSMLVQGPGQAALTVSGNATSRVFAQSGSTLNTLRISGLTVANGLSAGPGGCIYGEGAVELTNSVVTGCSAMHSAVSGPPIANGVGGGVAAYALQLQTSTVSGNTAQTAGGGTFTKYARVYQSVIANNTVTGQACDIGTLNKYCLFNLLGGGGMLALGPTQLIQSTISGNTLNGSALTNPGGTYLTGLGGGISHLTFKYGPVGTALSKTGVSGSVFGNLAPAARDARRAQVKAAFAASAARQPAATRAALGRLAQKVGARTKADGYAYPALGLYGSTVSGNKVTGNKSIEAKYSAGGILTATQNYNAEIANSTISGNSLDTTNPNGVNAIGSAIVADSLELTSSTVTGNVGSIVGVVFKYAPEMLAPTAKASAHPKLASWRAELRSTATALKQKAGLTSPRMKAAGFPIFQSAIVAGNGTYDVGCDNPCVISGANNLVQTFDDNVTLPPDTIVGQGAQLAPLANNGGVVAGAPGHTLTASNRTHLLLAGSPALDRGNNVEGFSFEQRGPGFPRVVGPRADIGAVEGISQTAPVPALAPWLVAALSALLGVLGLSRRRRSS